MPTATSCSEQMCVDGFVLVRSVVGLPEVQRLRSLLENLADNESIRSRGGVFAIRNLLDLVPELRKFAASKSVRDLVTPIIGDRAFPVRGIFFDKTMGANWKVPWHQDLTIAVEERAEIEGFGPWSTKAGVLHVQPPAGVLESLLSVRVHLDDCGEKNGALKVVPGSHRLGRVPEVEAAQRGADGPIVICAAEIGDALLMRPLLLHASSASESPQHRRVLHIDFASDELPGGLRWAAGRNRLQ